MSLPHSNPQFCLNPAAYLLHDLAAPSAGSSNGQTDGNRAAEPPQKKKKKKKKKKAANKPDLEDILENAEALEPEDPFDMSKSIAERVEIAVTRFRKNRKFSPERAKILSTYLDYGGIRSGPKSFQGGAVKSGGPDDDGEVDFEALNAGIDLVELPEDGQEIDFSNVVTTFLSQHFLKNTGWIDMVYYRDTPLVVAALLNYFLIRNVVPEHEADLRAALAVAVQAQIELPFIKMISNGWPSRYDKACSLLYGGEWYGFLDNEWQDQRVLIDTMGMDRLTAEKIVQSLTGPDVDIHTIKVSPREFLDLEIINVDLPDGIAATGDSPARAESPVVMPEEEEARIVAMVDKMLLGGSEAPTSQPDETESNGPEIEEAVIHIPALAKVTFAEWDSDLPREEQQPIDRRRKVQVYFDPSIATKMMQRMRVQAYVYTLSNGMSYLEQASVYPTFYLEADEIEGSIDDTDD
ncbi:Argonaute siRNA chaperone complex subunit Arb1-domain-containing protein [Gamsiella multidivaricata]|uniref:Argonaute siRNA chaperone complex subunit Arb1-domain-containing protein n=1 Tax=Gamsiella multidivaricata TaxID=101098 RepID=UPI00221F76A4|nr:Argonaute siRNA chaperone complex subunit Arb1-domain-containing protein [Gamsiella multidivaricata]KAI7821007.1 Argonaute siRNA chaperone complex subunit Arb1-domain-containing protein [Gamsiella multidivaricata]